jgi:hypothetical protein
LVFCDILDGVEQIGMAAQKHNGKSCSSRNSSFGDRSPLLLKRRQSIKGCLELLF